jgi:hypothetical protein
MLTNLDTVSFFRREQFYMMTIPLLMRFMLLLMML